MDRRRDKPTRESEPHAGDDRGVSVRMMLGLGEQLRHEGVDVPKLLREAGASDLAAGATTGFLPRDVSDEIWRLAERATDPAIGLRTAANVNYRAFEMLTMVTDFVIMQLFTTSATVGDALAQVSSAYGLVYGAIKLSYVEEAKSARAILSAPPDAPLPPSFVEFSLTVLGCAMQQLSVSGVVPLEVTFTHPAPRPSRHPVSLPFPLRFEADENALILSREAAAAKMRAANPELAARVRERAADTARAWETGLTMTERVRSHLARNLATGDVTAEATARHVDLSVRQLSRRLAEEGTSHRALLEELRAKLAERYAREGNLPSEEISARLGYSDPSAFRRAQRRWTAPSK